MTDNLDIRIEHVDKPEDLVQAFDCLCATFGRQVQDGCWMAMNPGWDTPQGRVEGSQRMIERWQGVKKTAAGDPTTVFLKATVPDPHNSAERLVVGMAIWLQASLVEGQGEVPKPSSKFAKELEARFPDDEPLRRFLAQVVAGLYGPRMRLLEEKSKTSQPAVFALDCCIVDPAYQRKGIAKDFVLWGLEEAKRRGDLELVTEGSRMGRKQYAKLGFVGVEEVEYTVDEEFAGRSLPPNLFMRTRPL
jgi:GNAT superfamily N-acetyltransferase